MSLHVIILLTRDFKGMEILHTGGSCRSRRGDSIEQNSKSSPRTPSAPTLCSLKGAAISIIVQRRWQKATTSLACVLNKRRR